VLKLDYDFELPQQKKERDCGNLSYNYFL